MMKALTLRQPWSWIVLHLGKRLENRRWSTSFRGEFALHASSRMTDTDYTDALFTCIEVLGSNAVLLVPPPSELTLGAIVGVTRLEGVLPRCPGLPCPHPWHMEDVERGTGETQYGLMLQTPRELREPVPCKGALGFWTLPEDVEQLVRERMFGRKDTSTHG